MTFYCHKIIIFFIKVGVRVCQEGPDGKTLLRFCTDKCLNDYKSQVFLNEATFYLLRQEDAGPKVAAKSPRVSSQVIKRTKVLQSPPDQKNLATKKTQLGQTSLKRKFSIEEIIQKRKAGNHMFSSSKHATSETTSSIPKVETNETKTTNTTSEITPPESLKEEQSTAGVENKPTAGSFGASLGLNIVWLPIPIPIVIPIPILMTPNKNATVV